jgi:hypothetical protein
VRDSVDVPAREALGFVTAARTDGDEDDRHRVLGEVGELRRGLEGEPAHRRGREAAGVRGQVIRRGAGGCICDSNLQYVTPT